MGMKDGKLIHLLSEIDESELKILIKFAKSPYHNTNKLIVLLLQKMLSYHPDFNHKKLTKEHLYHSIHPEGKSYHEGRMNLLMTNLVSVVQEFYMYQEFQKDKILQRRLKGKAYSNRNLYKNYKKEVKSVLVDLEKSPYREEDYFFQKYDVQQEFFFHVETPTGHDGAVFLYDSMDSLDKFYMTAKLTLAAEQITMTKKLKASSEIKFLDEIQNHLEKEEENAIPTIINIYHKFLKIRQTGHSQKYYDELKDLLLGNLNSIELLKQKLIYYNLINHGINLLNQNKLEIRPQVLSLYKLGLEQNYIINNNKITSVTYLNIITSASKLGEFAWGKFFIENNKKFLPKEEEHSVYLMASALWNQHKGNQENYKHFYTSLELLREVKYNKKLFFIFILSRTLWIRTCYDLLKNDDSYYFTLIDYIRNFDAQLRKDKVLTVERRQPYFSFLFFIKKIVKIFKKKEMKIDKINELMIEVNQSSRMVSKLWILQKLEELRVKFL